LKQHLLAMKDIVENSGGGVAYDSTTVLDLWRMMAYDNKPWEITEQFPSLFRHLGVQKERWLKDYSVLVDCMYVALISGGIVVG